ncbi:MAG TPA: MBL fold metallo-hydrolase [Acidobacteriota bacterium]|nr:MBL fold metallo-hydrolase [Acidobacteriota bacterium]
MFWGAARTVTGSKHLLLGRSGALLLDCGLFQGRRAESEARNRALPFAAMTVDALVLSHAHIDHSGAIPLLVKSGFDGAIHATPATADLCRAMLLDAAHIQAKDAEWLNRHETNHRRGGNRGGARGGKNHRRPIEPLYDVADVERALARFVPHDYGESFEPIPGVEADFSDAGHILGSAAVRLAWKDGGPARSLVFSGDQGRPHRPIIRDPAPLPSADYLILEGTYGGKTHPGEDSLLESLERVVRETIARGGRIVVPAFAVGRTQEVVHALDRLIASGRIPELPIFIDSPLAADVQEIVQRHPEVYDAETEAALRRGHDPLGMRRVTMVREAEQSKQLNDRKGTFVTISASGMAEAGRVLHHLKHTIEDPRHTVVIVGYQAEGTLGRRLVEGVPEVRILGELHTVRARVEVLNGFSAHADHPALIAQAASCGAARGVAIVHADLERAEALRAGLPDPSRVRIPVEGDAWDLREGATSAAGPAPGSSGASASATASCTRRSARG